MWQVEITNNQTRETVVTEFAEYKKARTYFAEWCDEHNYSYDASSESSGGIGHDCFIELKKSN